MTRGIFDGGMFDPAIFDVTPTIAIFDPDIFDNPLMFDTGRTGARTSGHSLPAGAIQYQPFLEEDDDAIAALAAALTRSPF